MSSQRPTRLEAHCDGYKATYDAQRAESIVSTQGAAVGASVPQPQVRSQRLPSVPLQASASMARNEAQTPAGARSRHSSLDVGRKVGVTDGFGVGNAVVGRGEGGAEGGTDGFGLGDLLGFAVGMALGNAVGN